VPRAAVLPMTPFHRLVVSAGERLRRAGIPADQAAMDAELLARHAAAWDRVTYVSRRGEPPSEDVRRRFEAAIERRERREPIAYITGEREFWGRTFDVAPGVLIPRPETEHAVEGALAALADHQRRWRIADVGTGSGCIAVSLACELPASRVVATDVMHEALLVARRNAMRHGVASRLRFVRASLLAGLVGPFDLIVSNPPYVPSAMRAQLMPDVRDFEPEVALYGGGTDGLALVRTLVAESATRLAPAGRLMMEFGWDQGAEVRRIVERVPDLELVAILRDLQGHERTLVAERRLTTDD
jgi:release factor glutamine methyltransferase